MGSMNAAPVELIRRELPAPQFINNAVLVANTAKAKAKPAAYAAWLWIVNTDATNTVWCRFDGPAAAIPVADIDDGTGSHSVLAGNGLLLDMRTASQISMISAGASIVTLSWYREQGR